MHFAACCIPNALLRIWKRHPQTFHFIRIRLTNKNPTGYRMALYWVIENIMVIIIRFVLLSTIRSDWKSETFLFSIRLIIMYCSFIPQVTCRYILALNAGINKYLPLQACIFLCFVLVGMDGLGRSYASVSTGMAQLLNRNRGG